MATIDPLGTKVDSFIRDVDIVHAVTHGDIYTTVQTEQGPISSLAKLIHDAGLSLENFKFSLVTSNPILVQDGMFTLPSPAIGGVVWNMAILFVDLTLNDFYPDGSLKCDREYEVEDHTGVQVATDRVTVNIAGNPANLDGKYAQVSYLTCLS